MVTEWAVERVISTIARGRPRAVERGPFATQTSGETEGSNGQVDDQQHRGCTSYASLEFRSRGPCLSDDELAGTDTQDHDIEPAPAGDDEPRLVNRVALLDQPRDRARSRQQHRGARGPLARRGSMDL